MEKENKALKIPIKVETPPDLVTAHVDYFFVRHTEDATFLISFGLIEQPYLTDPEEIKKLEHVPAKIVSRVALSPAKMEELIDVLTRNYKTFKSKQPG